MKNYPLVSFCVLSYNQEDFIAEAVLSVIKQDYPNLEIIISDDNSPDNTYNVIERIVKGNPTNHNVILNKNKSNLGLINHLNYVFNDLVHGEYIILMGGDDISTPDRTSLTVNYFLQYPNIGGLVFSYNVINSLGQYQKTLKIKKDTIYNIDSFRWFSSPSFVIGGLALAFKKSKYDLFGPLGDCHTEDSTIRFRVLLCSDFLCSNKICLQYRRHDSNITSSANLYSLRTENISNQYYKDLNIAYENNFISKKRYRLMNNKIKWYKRVRCLQEMSHYSEHFVSKLVYHIYIKMVNVAFYLRSIVLRIV